MVRIFVLEDELLIAKQLKRILLSFGYLVPYVFDNSDDVIDVIGKGLVDLYLLDINIRGSRDGVEVAEIIKKTEEIPFVFVTSYSDVDTINRAKVTCPNGYLVKPFDENDIFSTVEIALFTSSQKITKPLSIDSIESRFGIELTPREFQTLHHLLEGLTNAQIASAEYVSVNTVKTHLRNLYSKFDVADRLKLVHKVLSLN